MDKNVKKMFLLTTIVLLLLGIGAVSAANDTSDNTQTTVSNDLTTIDSCSSQIATVASDNKVVNTKNDVVSNDKISVKKDKTNTTSNIKTTTKSSDKTGKTLKKEDEINYYVSDSKGSDTNDGSKDNPFKTIGHAVNLTTASSIYNIHITEGTYKGIGNTNLTVPGSNKINFIGAGVNKTIFDGEAKYDIQKNGFYWGSSEIWYNYVNASGNWFMNITPGAGKITFTNFTMQNGWVKGGSNIAAYKIAPVDNYATLTIDNVYFYKNHCGAGTVRNRETGNLTVNNSIFDFNLKSDSTGNFGAGIYNNGTTLVVNSIFVGNYARWGTLTNDRIMKVNNCTIRDNKGYDGTSTYKYGSGIATNTGSADYYNEYGVNGLETEVTNCTFINNDQTDIWQGQGDLVVSNSKFINSTGIYIEGKKLNMSVSQNITNNTFTNVVGSALTVSMSSKSKPAIAIRSTALGFNLTITNNTINAPDLVNGKAIQVSGYATITNNQMDNVINIKGSGCLVNNNTINTKSGYTVVEETTAKNNSYTNNTLYSSILAGDNSLKLNSKGNSTTSGNKPEVTNHVISNDNYSQYFTNEGVLKTDVVTNGSKIFLSGNLINKEFIFDNIKVYVGNNDTAKLINSVIKTQNNAKVIIENININNTDSEKEYVVLFNSTGNQLIKTNIDVNTTHKIHAIVLADDENTIENVVVNVAGPSKNIDWTQNVQIADTIGLLITSSNNNIKVTKINLYAHPNGEMFGTVDGIDIQSLTNNTVKSNLIYNTRVNVTGGQYAYGLNIKNAENTNTSLVWSDVRSDNYACAFQLTGIARNNNIAGYAYANAPVLAYGAYITGLWSGGVNNTNISKLYIQNVTSNEAYGVCLEGVLNTTISDATYNVFGNKTFGIVLNNTENTNIFKLTIKTENTNENSSIIITDKTKNTNITGTTLNSNNANGVNLINNTNTSVVGNYININNMIGGNNAVKQVELTNNNVTNNIPNIIVISDETYPNYFDENSTLNITADIINIGKQLNNKILYMNTNATFYNPYNTTINNVSFIFIGTNTKSVTFNGLKINNVNKSVIETKLNTTLQKNVYFKNGYIKLTGENITAINNNGNTLYLSVENTQAILNATNNALFISYTGRGYSYIQNSNITVDSGNISKVIQNDNGTVSGANNNIKQTGNIAITINGTCIINQYDGFKNNNITISGNNITAININQYTLTLTTLQNNKFNLTSSNPAIAINMENTGFAGGWSWNPQGTSIKNNVFIINAVNKNTPVISLSGGSLNSVTNNYIEARDVWGNNAVEIIGENGTIENNNPNNNTNYTAIMNITAPTTTSVNKTIDVNVTLTDVFGNPIKENITITVDGTEIGIIDGAGSITYTPTTGKTSTITATFNGNDKYDSSVVSTTLNVMKLNTTTTVNTPTGKYNDTITITANVVDSNNNPVNGGKVVFIVNGETICDSEGNIIYANVENGVATINTTALRTWVNKYSTICAEYIGNDVYGDSTSEYSTMNISLRTPTVTILTDKTSVKSGEKVLFIVQVRDGEKLVNQGSVIFKLNGITLKDTTGNIYIVKVENGIAKLEYIIPDGFSAKNYTLTTVYVGKDYERGSDVSSLIVPRINTYIKTEMTNITSDNATLKLTIFDENNKIILRNTKVTVKVNGKTFYNQIIVSNGTADLNLNLPVSSKPYNITVIAGENNAYASSNYSFMFTNTVKIPTKINATANVVNNKTAVVSVKIYDNNNKPVTGNTKVVVKLNGKTQATTHAENGVADLNITVPQIKGMYNLVVVTGETAKYLASQTTIPLRV